MEVGQRVTLKYFPFCDGVIVEVLEPLKIGEFVVRQNYKVQWDDPSYGITDLISAGDLLVLKDKQQTCQRCGGELATLTVCMNSSCDFPA